MLARDASPRFLLHGTRGSFKKYGLDPQEPALVAGAHVPRLNEAPSAEPDHWLTEQESHWGLLTVAPDPHEPGILVTRKLETRPGDYRGFYANVRDAIRGVAPLAVTPEDGYRTIKLLELARESSVSRRTLAVEF
jgi:predicted dehydrogenase